MGEGELGTELSFPVHDLFGTVRKEIYLIPNGRLLYVVVVGGEDLLPRLDVPLRHQGHDQTKPEVEVTKKQNT